MKKIINLKFTIIFFEIRLLKKIMKAIIIQKICFPQNFLKDLYIIKIQISCIFIQISMDSCKN